MIDTSQTIKPWLTFAGCVLVVVVLYWAQAVLVPVALAELVLVLVSFMLLERRDLTLSGIYHRARRRFT